MQLAEKPMLRSYHALDYDWTPLSRNPCWLSNAVYRLRCYVRRNRLCLISSVGYQSTNDYCQLLLMLNGESDKSFVDDLVASRYCKCESSLCCYEALRFILCFYDLFFSVWWLFLWFVLLCLMIASIICSGSFGEKLALPLAGSKWSMFRRRVFLRSRELWCQCGRHPVYLFFAWVVVGCAYA